MPVYLLRRKKAKSQGSTGCDDILEQSMSLAGDYRHCVHRINSGIAETCPTEVKATHDLILLTACVLLVI